MRSKSYLNQYIFHILAVSVKWLQLQSLELLKNNYFLPIENHVHLFNASK